MEAVTHAPTNKNHANAPVAVPVVKECDQLVFSPKSSLDQPTVSF